MANAKWFKDYGPLMRAVGVMGAVGILVTSVTYAALQSQPASLTGNTIKSASADLRIGTSASTFAASRTGFTFAEVMPGGPAMPADGQIFYLKNYGTANMALKVAVASTPSNTSSIDLNKVFILLTRVETGTQQTFSLQELVDAQSAGGKAVTDPLLTTAAVGQYKLRAMMAADAYTGTGVDVSIGGIDLVFSGVPVES